VSENSALAKWTPKLSLEYCITLLGKEYRKASLRTRLSNIEYMYSVFHVCVHVFICIQLFLSMPECIAEYR
jgi:hypothetical protein